MKLKRTVLLATFVVTLGLLLGASAAQAATVETDDEGNVTKILNLEVFDPVVDTDITYYNVEFVYDTAINVYATGEFDFPIAADADEAQIAVHNALNAEDPVPPGAGPQGSDQFFIGSTERFGRVLALGSEITSGTVELWGDCFTDCFVGTDVLDPDEPFTYAKFTEFQDVPPGPATLISPSGFITGDTPTYTWNAVADSRWYNLIVKDNTEEVIIDDWYTAEAAGCGDGTGECSVTPLDVLADGLHQWLIQTWNEFGEGPESDGMSFTVDTTGATPGPATLISPSGAITDNAPTYTWNAVANSTWYRLWVEDSTKTKIIDDWYTADEARCIDGTGQCSVITETVLADDSHEWWIQTWNDNGRGPWSDELSFTVDTSVPPEPATLISPSGTITDNTPTYTWNAVADSTWYRLWVEDSTQTKIIDQWYAADDAGCSDGTGQCSVTPETVLADDSHEWWIRTWNQSGFGPWSNPLSFTVDTSNRPSVETDENGNVIRITNLQVVDEDTEEPVIYDVEFRYESAIDVYGSGLVTDFSPPTEDTEETIILAMEAVLDALNFEDPIPPGAGTQGTDQFFIGYKEENGAFVAVGGENFSKTWGPCATGCGPLNTGVTLLNPGDTVTYADFTTLVIADAGPDQEVSRSATVRVNGSTSTPFAVNQTGTFSWAFLDLPPDSLAVLSPSDSPSPTFRADEVGTYTVELTYTVGADSDTDTVVVTAE